MSSEREITRLVEVAEPLSNQLLADLYAPSVPGAPTLRVNLVTTIDGAAEHDGSSSGLSSSLDQRLMGLLRMQCDALLVGAGTLRIERYGPLRMDGPHARWRQERGLPPHPTLVVVSDSLRLDPQLSALAEAPVRPIVVTRATSPASRQRALAATTELVTFGEEAVDLTATLDWLRRRGLCQVLSEGGPHLFGALTAADLVDELCLTVSPLLAGAGASRITAGRGSSLRAMSLHQVLAAGDMLFLRYRRTRGVSVASG